MDDTMKGWLYVAGACVCFGSFGLPIKHPTVLKANVHPLVYQTYKSVWCFATSWLVLLWHDMDFTPWGFVSAAFWVPAGVATVVSITNCGMAVGQGVSTTLIVIVSFVWGAVIFQEEFHSLPLACFGALLIIVGAIGMTYFGVKKQDEHASEPSISSFTKPDHMWVPAERPKSDSPSLEDPEAAAAGHSNEAGDVESRRLRRHLSAGEGSRVEAATQQQQQWREDGGEKGIPRIVSEASLESTDSDERFQALLGEVTESEEDAAAAAVSRGEAVVGDRETWQGRSDVFVELCGFRLRRRTYGIMAAVFNGCYGGSVLAPLKLAKGAASGIAFVISFGIGVLGITSLIWLGWFVLYQTGRIKEPLPSLQPRVMLVPGSISGILWALGNFCSLYAVIYLGQAVGYSSCQTNIAISGAWGIFYYQEQMAPKRIAAWFAAAAVAIGGIITLTLAK